ncbi:MAG TPA: hypothetical protein VN709_11015 [Terriglobales bacterium]|nr:hypothetical protein [Terriglobales bacterium]
MNLNLASGARLLAAFALAACVASASSFSGTLTPAANRLTWTGTQTGVIGETQTGTGLANPPCNASVCDLYALTVTVPATFYAANPTFSIHASAAWASSLNEFDVYVYDSSGNLVGMSTNSGGVSNDADLGQLPSGTYQIQIVPTIAANTSYTGLVTLAAEPSVPTGRARYRLGDAQFSVQQLTRPPSTVNTTPAGSTFFEQDAEPRIVHDALGNLFVTAIQGVPGGSDTWKSMDAGRTFTYLGEPDGTQAAGSQLDLVGAGVGGGDEDLIALPNGNLVMTSLWLGGNTTCVSSDSGTTWICNPDGSTLPADDRQWLANYGNQTVYITTKQLGADLVGTSSLYAARSSDGGVTFPFVSQITTPELGVQPGDQGNILVDQSNGAVYNVFFSSGSNQLYLAKSVNQGQTWILKLVVSAPPNVSLAHVFPSLALDGAGNLYIAYSDGANSYLTSSTDGGATWKTPVIVNAGPALRTTVEPWVVAGDAGKVNVFFYGTPAASYNTPTAQWHIYMAQSQNALAPVPTFYLNTASPPMHIGAICNDGLACASGTRNLLEYFYPDTYLDGSALAVYPDDLNVNHATTTTAAFFLKQTAGTRIAGPKQ